MRYMTCAWLLVSLSLLASCGAGGSGTTSSAPSSPAVVNGVSYSAGVVTISGTGFGSKTTAAPVYFDDFESQTLNSFPSGQITNLSAYGVVKSNVYRGSKSLEFDYCADYAVLTWATATYYMAGNVVSYGGNEYRVLNSHTSSANPTVDTVNYVLGSPSLVCANGKRQNDWQRNAVNLGQTADRIYISAWVYLDKGASTSTSWQWKPLLVTSSSSLYYDLSTTYPSTNLPYSSAAYNTTAAFTSCWFNGSSFFNNGGYVYYYDNLSLYRNITGATAGSKNDRYLWGGWQRLEWYAQRASGSGVADGIWREKRIGYPGGAYNFNITNAITHLTGNDQWRYVVLTNAIESVYDGHVAMNLYMDDIYIDTTPARVEIGNSSDFESCTHREVQYPTAWSDTQIKVNLRPGSFASGSQVYFFVVNANGTASQVGSAFTMP